MPLITMVTGKEMHPKLPAKLSVHAFVLKKTVFAKQWRIERVPFFKADAKDSGIKDIVTQVQGKRAISPSSFYGSGKTVKDTLGFWYENTYTITQASVIEVAVTAKNIAMPHTTNQSNRFAQEIRASLFLYVDDNAGLNRIEIPTTRMTGYQLGEASIQGRFRILTLEELTELGYDQAVHPLARQYLDESFRKTFMLLKVLQPASGSQMAVCKKQIQAEDGTVRKIAFVKPSRSLDFS